MTSARKEGSALGLDTKDFYRDHHDRITAKRFNSPFPIRQCVHRDMYEQVLRFVEPGMRVLDAGCGEGTLSALMASKGAEVVGVDLSVPNLQTANELWADQVHTGRLTFIQADAEQLPFNDRSFDLVVSNHVLEHLPNFERGLSEVLRVTSSRFVIALPTCLSLYSAALLGNDVYWKFSWRSPQRLLFGIGRILMALVLRKEGVNEGYAGRQDIVHFFRFPWILPRMLEERQVRLLETAAQGIGFPYLNVSVVDADIRRALRYFGLGTVYFGDVNAA